MGHILMGGCMSRRVMTGNHIRVMGRRMDISHIIMGRGGKVSHVHP
jgi:hypothetical protein